MASRMTGALAGNPSASPSSAGKKRGNFSLSYRIQDASKVPTKQIYPVMFFAGTYPHEYFDDDGNITSTPTLPHGQILRHWSPIKKKFVRCTDGLKPGYNRDGDYTIFPAQVRSCNGCVEADKPKDERRISFGSPCTVWNLIELGWFHEVDSDRVNERTHKPYKDWEHCLGDSCKLCNAGNEKTFGRRLSLTLNWNQSRQLTRYDLIDLAKLCRCGGEIEPKLFRCEKCGAVMHDCDANPATDSQLLQLRSLAYKCGCGHEAPLTEENACDRCEDPKPLSLTDVMFRLYFPAKTKEERKEEEEKDKGRKDTSLTFSNPKLVTDAIREKVAPLMKPFDLDRIYPVLKMAQQAQVLGVQNHFSQERQEPKSEGQVERKAQTEESSGAEDWADDEIPF